jgi:hypothetical protein
LFPVFRQNLSFCLCSCVLHLICVFNFPRSSFLSVALCGVGDRISERSEGAVALPIHHVGTTCHATLTFCVPPVSADVLPLHSDASLWLLIDVADVACIRYTPLNSETDATPGRNTSDFSSGSCQTETTGGSQTFCIVLYNYICATDCFDYLLWVCNYSWYSVIKHMNHPCEAYEEKSMIFLWRSPDLTRSSIW